MTSHTDHHGIYCASVFFLRGNIVAKHMVDMCAGRERLFDCIALILKNILCALNTEFRHGRLKGVLMMIELRDRVRKGGFSLIKIM